MSVRVHLVRHCAHGDLGRILTGRSKGCALSAEGRAHAHRLAGDFAGRERIGAVQTSPRTRARETAHALGERLKLQAETVDALDEIEFGAWNGRAFSDLEGDPAWRRWNSARATAATPGGETMGQATQRAVAHVERLAAAEPREAVVCVTHCDIIRGVVAHYLGLSLDRVLAFDVDPGSTTSLQVEVWGARLLTLNRGIA